MPLRLRAELLLGQRCDTKVDLYSLGEPLGVTMLGFLLTEVHGSMPRDSAADGQMVENLVYWPRMS